MGPFKHLKNNISKAGTNGTHVHNEWIFTVLVYGVSM